MTMASRLPKEQLNHLNAALRAFDNRDYAKVYKECDSIFKKFPDNSEALSIRALAVQGHQHREKELREALANATASGNAAAIAAATKVRDELAAVPTENPYDICKKAIAGDMRCVMAWHAMGTLHRTDKNNAQAFQSFKQALKVEQLVAVNPDGTVAFNQNLLRDATSMAVQLRDWESLVEIRQRALAVKAQIRVHWTFYSAAHYLAGNLELASAIADTVCKVMEPGDDGPATNELLLYRAQLKLDRKDAHGALAILNGTIKGEAPSVITDRSEKNKLLAKAYAAAKMKAQAKKVIEELLAARDSERDMLFLLAQVEGITLDPITDADGGEPREVKPSMQFVALLDDIASRHKRCDPARRLALDYFDIAPSAGEAVAAAEAEFTKRLAEYVTYYVKNLVPSLVTVLTSLYSSPGKVRLIEKLFLGWKEKLEKGDESDFNSTAATTSTHKNPTLLLSVYDFLAAHYRMKGEYALAHEHIDKAIKHSPTHEVLYLAKARIFNAQGNHKEAAPLADKAQQLDLQDKYLNNKAAQYIIRSGDIELAERRMGLFFKPSIVDDTFLNSIELQYTWYEREVGAAYLARGDYPNAIQFLSFVEKHHLDNHEELADFHTYSLRRNNMRQWLDTVKVMEEFSGTNHYLQACPWLVRAYIGVFDLGGDDQGVSKAFDPARHTPRKRPQHPDLLPEEQRRLDKIWESFFSTKPDLTNPLDKALKYVVAMQKYRKNSFETHELAFEVHARAGRVLQCVSAVAQLRRIVEKEHRGPAKDAAQRIAALQDRLVKDILPNTAKDERVKQIASAAVAKFAGK